MGNQERPTKEFTTSGGVKIVYRSFITGREFNELERIYRQSAKLKLVDGRPDIEGFDMGAHEKVTNRTIEIAVISVDGQTEKILDAVLDLPVVDYNEIVDALQEVSGKKKAAPTNKQ